MKKKDLLNKKNINLIKAYIIQHKKQDTLNALDDFFLMFDSCDDVMLAMSYKILDKSYYINRIFELNKLDIVNGKLEVTKVSCCEIMGYENCENPRIYINFIGTNHENFMGRGYNYMLLRVLEQYAIEHNANHLYGLYLPLSPGDEYKTHKFYERNKFTHYIDFSTEYSEEMILKVRKDFRSLSFVNLKGLKTSSNVFEKEEKESYINLHI